MHVLFLVTTLVSGNAFAEKIQARIHSVVQGEGSNPHHLRLDNGRVVFMNSEEKSLSTFGLENNLVEIETDEENNLLSIQTLSERKGLEMILDPEVQDPDLSYEPTIIQGYAEAEKIFNRLNGNYQRVSQCFNRAHVWSKEEFDKYSIKSMKTFVFFTASYINRNRFNWWFHVAPMLKVQEGDAVVDRVLDFRYTDSPVTVREWTDLFVFSKRPCLLTTKFSEYDVNPQTEDCYLMNVPMYYWQPQNIAWKERGQFSTSFNSASVRDAYSEAF